MNALSDAQSWEAAADPRRRVGHAVEFHPVIGSTNDRARELLRVDGGRSDEGVAIVADLQTAGRGRHGRVWLSPPGTNLMVSVAVRPMLAARDAWRLVAAALAGAAACEPWARVSVKWPNDLVAADGRKLGGILIETSLEGERVVEAVIGMGLNVNWRADSMPPEIAPTACSLADLAGAPVDRVAVLARYLEALDRELAELAAGRSPIERLRAVSWLDGRPVSVDSGTGVVTGRAASIDDHGRLLVATDAGMVAVAFGDVVHVRPAHETAA